MLVSLIYVKLTGKTALLAMQKNAPTKNYIKNIDKRLSSA
jgi:hypothetical protein